MSEAEEKRPGSVGEGSGGKKLVGWSQGRGRDRQTRTTKRSNPGKGDVTTQVHPQTGSSHYLPRSRQEHMGLSCRGLKKHLTRPWLELDGGTRDIDSGGGTMTGIAGDRQRTGQSALAGDGPSAPILSPSADEKGRCQGRLFSWPGQLARLSLRPTTFSAAFSIVEDAATTVFDAW